MQILKKLYIPVVICLAVMTGPFLSGVSQFHAFAEDLPWGSSSKPPQIITPDETRDYAQSGARQNPEPRYNDSYRPPAQGGYQSDRYTGANNDGARGAGRPYGPPQGEGRYGDPYQDEGPNMPDYNHHAYSNNEILQAGHDFFGNVTKGLAKIIQYAFDQSGRPNGYILGEEAGGAFVAGLRYGEGTLFTKHMGRHKVYWQGPSIGYDFGAEGSKTMVLVYKLRHPEQIFQHFAGVNGSAYFVGGAGITYQQKGDLVLARIQSGVGVRLGANVGYLKYTPRPTWNPF